MIQLTMPIDMPESCYGCPFDYDNIRCMAIIGYEEGSFDKYYNKGFKENGNRLPNCPLKAVMPLETIMW